ncbi:hypothetical protein PtB15_8B45 [Puccinia triticina]|nr:hypothetical protein PtB15_8B45 [Puccinia triticina]
MADLDAQSQSRAEPAQEAGHRPLVHPEAQEYDQALLDFDLDTYHHLFTQDIPHSASSALELDYPHPQFTSAFQLQPPAASATTPASDPNSPPSSASSSGPPNQLVCLQSPAWSSLDQLFLAALPQPPQSSPLFPLDRIPNPASSFDQSHQQQPFNLLNNLSLDFALEPHHWNLAFDPTYSSSSDIPLDFYSHSSFLQPSDCIEFTENDCQQQLVQPMFLHDQHPSPPEQHFKLSNRPGPEEEEHGGAELPACVDHPEEPITAFASPASRQETPSAPTIPMKRARSSHSQSDERPLSVAPPQPAVNPADLAGRQLIEPDSHHNIQLQTSQESKPKRAKARSSNPSSVKPHVCPECGKSFPRLTSLTQHKTTHNGERPFRCGFEGCNKSFTTSSNCKRHCKTHQP